MFHLLSHAGGTGGESLFVDGYAAASYVQDNQPLFYAALHRCNIIYHASGNSEVGEIDNSAVNFRGRAVLAGGLSYGSKKRALEAGRGIMSQIEAIDRRQVPTQIRWNNDDRAPHVWRSLNEMELWYNAASYFSQVLKKKQFELKVQLEPGRPIIFDNWRYLHGRTAFTGSRRVCGGYSKFQPAAPSFRSLFNISDCSIDHSIRSLRIPNATLLLVLPLHIS
jgi:trimethyllysine dioxygenase